MTQRWMLHLLGSLILAMLLAGCPSEPEDVPAVVPPDTDDQPTTDLTADVSHLRVDWNTRQDHVPWEAAITLAELSTVAYTDPGQRRPLLQQVGFDETTPLDDGPMSGYMAMTDDVAVIVFRGTDFWSLDDWLINVDFAQRESPQEGHHVHRGFWQAYNRFTDEIDGELSDRDPEYVWMTGHSLGGAMATCCAYDWLVAERPFSGLVTFGQPRVGNKAMAQYLHGNLGQRVMRFINEDDVIPRLPPNLAVVLPDYWHLGSRIRFQGADLDRLHGVVPYSARVFDADEASAPESDPSATAPAPLTPAAPLGDGEETISEADFNALKEYLRARQVAAAPAERPQDTFVPYSDTLPGSSPTESAPGVGGAVSPRVARLYGGLSDHAIDQYVRQLNAFRRSQDTE